VRDVEAVLGCQRRDDAVTGRHGRRQVDGAAQDRRFGYAGGEEFDAAMTVYQSIYRISCAPDRHFVIARSEINFKRKSIQQPIVRIDHEEVRSLCTFGAMSMSVAKAA
jgi:hypothetical protein